MKKNMNGVSAQTGTALTKNQVVSLNIESVDGLMNGVAHVNGQAVFVAGALDGECVRAQIVKCTKHYAFARINSLETENPARIDPPCPFYKQCGGCSALHMTYRKTLEVKRQAVEQVFKRIGRIDFSVPLVLGMDEPFHYRNKTVTPVGGSADWPKFGFFSPRSHRLVPINDCLIAKKQSILIAETVMEWMQKCRTAPYDELTCQGLVRHIMSRVAKDGRCMAVIIAAHDNLPQLDLLCNLLKERVQGLVSVCLMVNTQRGNTILGSRYRVLWGQDRLTDDLCGFRFALSPLSFFQINPLQTEKLYQTALDFAGLSPNETAADLYCGAGTISLLLARKAKHVIGVEIVEAAIRDAKENALANGVDNVSFYTAAVEDLLPTLVNDGLRPDVIVLDPPRKGAEPSVLQAILQAAPSRIVYISCDPATQARDVRILSDGGYVLRKMQPVDMFCWTSHVETVCLLVQRNSLHIDIDVDVEEMLQEKRGQATYAQIKDYVLEQNSLKVSSLYISQVKRKCGLDVSDSYNKPKSEDAIVPQCPPEKEEAIMNALRHFEVI